MGDDGKVVLGCNDGAIWIVLFSFKGAASRMSTSQDQNGSSAREPLWRCCDARRDLELAIGGVLRAEQQIKDNLREVGCVLFTCLVWT